MAPPSSTASDTPQPPGGVPCSPLGPDALLGYRHRLGLLRRRPLTAMPRSLPPDEERGRGDDRDPGHPDVQAQAGDLVRGVDPQRLDPEPADAVDEDVEREEVARPEPELAFHEQEHACSREAPESFVEERRVEGRALDVVDRPVVRGDLEAPRQVGRLAEELLVPPVPEAADPLRDEQRRRHAVRKSGDARAGAPGDDRPDQDAEPDASPHAEAALPDRERPPPLVRELVPARDHVVQPGADDPERDAPDGEPEDEVPVAPAARPADPRDDDRRDDRDEQR